MLLATFLSPLLMVIVAVVAVAMAKEHSVQKPRISVLVGLSIAFAIVGAVVSLIATIGWMAWYERSTGYSAGNGPLGWIFLYGPASAAIGQLVALIVWWFKKPKPNGAPDTAA